MRGKTGSLTLSNRLLLLKLYRSGKASFGSIKSLAKASGLPRDLVEKFLQSRKAYTKFKQANRKIKRLPTRARSINDTWSMDLAQVDKLAEWNSGVKFLMVVVDLFSRFVRVEPLRNKNAETTKAAFIKMCSKLNTTSSATLQFPKKLWVDRGKEFMGDFKNFCEDVGIKIYHTHSETKACHAERAIRSLKTIIYRYLEEMNTDKYLPKLQSFVQTMNSRVNRSIGMSPDEVENGDFLKIMYSNLKQPKSSRQKSPKYKVGDTVRLSRVTNIFRKGYKPQFTDEIFIVTRIATVKPVITYNLKDQENEPIYGKFYEAELSKFII